MSKQNKCFLYATVVPEEQTDAATKTTHKIKKK